MELSPPSPKSGTRRSRSAITLLADQPTRAILLTLGDAAGVPGGGFAITEHPFAGVTPRLVRDRLRGLERLGLAVAVERAAGHGDGPTLWALTAAGRALFNLYALLERIAGHAAELPANASPAERAAALDLALTTLADPAATRLLETLALSATALDPPTLEASVAPVPRRTLYRRLTPLVEAKVVHRIVGRTVPRSTTYLLHDRWRPVAAIAVLSLWWESRHWPEVQIGDANAIYAVLYALAPLVHLPAASHGQVVQWTVQQPSGALTGTVACTDGRLTVARSGATPSGAAVAASAAGSPAVWADALVTGRVAELELGGNTELTRRILAALRAALLTYVR
ncbi:MAG: hypothetical protein QM679_03015 [Patulibacter sp.]